MSAYLLGNIIFAVVWVGLYLAKPQTRKIQLVGSFLLLPFALLDIWFRQNYWHPPLLIKAIEPLSLETAIYCFTAGGIAMVLGSFFLRYKAGKIIWSRIFLFLTVSLALYFIFEFFVTKINSMNCLNIAFLIVWIYLLLNNFQENYKSIFPGMIMAVFTILAINLALLFFPHFVSEYWYLDKLWPTFINTPTEEIFFAGVLGSLWSLLPKYLMKN